MNIDIRALRAQIDQVDDRLCEMFETRMTLAAQIAVYKHNDGMDAIDEAREQEIIERLIKKVNGPISSYIPLLYETLFDLSHDYQAYVLED